MDDDDDYFTPTVASSRRLAMLFSPEDVTSSGSSSRTSNSSSPSSQFKFVAPKQPRSSPNNSSIITSGSGQPASGDGQEKLIEVSLILLPEGTEKNGMKRTRVSCQVVGSAAQRSFSLVVARVEQVKGELWRAAIDFQLALEVVEHSIVKVTAHTNETLTLHGEIQQIEALVMQVAICRGVVSSRVTQQDLHAGKGHVLAEGDVAKVFCATYAITVTARRGEKVEEVKGVKVTVSSPTTGTWESCLVGATAESHRLIFIPKLKNGSWQPPTHYYDVKIDRVKTKGGKEKAVAGARTSSQPQEQYHTPTSYDSPLATNPLSVPEARVEAGDSHDHDARDEEDRASKKAALVTRMAQVGTQIFPLLPSARPASQSQVVERSREASTEVEASAIPTLVATSPTPATTNPTPTTTSIPTTLSTSALMATTTTLASSSISDSDSAPDLIPGPVPAIHPQAPSEAHDTTLAHSVSHLDTTITKIADRVELLLAKVERVETKSRVEAEGGCVPETLRTLASGLVAHNEKLKIQLEVMEKRLAESQAAQASLLTMNTQLLEEKRKMLRKEAELKNEVEAKEEELKKRVTEENTVQEKKERSCQNEKEPGLTPKEVQSLVKATLNGLFHHMANDFKEEKMHYSQPQVLQTLRSGLEVAYSSLIESLEKMTEREAEREQEDLEEGGQEYKGQEGGGNGGEKEKRQTTSGESSPGQE